MANPLLLDIATFLVANSLAAGDGVDIFRDTSPSKPDDIVILHEYGGSPTVPYPQGYITHRSVQLSVRSADADTARTKALAIFTALQIVQGDDNKVQLTEDRWCQVYFRQTPFLIKRDSNDRAYYGFNMGLTTTID